jgi:1,4-dihydroxy-2-naphthoyl-CoA hydrolase
VAVADEAGQAGAIPDGEAGQAIPGGAVPEGGAGEGTIPDAWGDVNLLHDNTLVRRMGIKITEASADRVVGTMPVEGNIQPYGLLHGGASCVLAETLGSTGAALHAGRGKIVVGIEINATHHRGAFSGDVTGVATKLHGGQTMASYEIVITDDRGRRVCTARLSCLVRGAVPGEGRAPA